MLQLLLKAGFTLEEGGNHTRVLKDGILVSVVSQKPVKVAVSFPKYALAAIDLKADKLGLTRSGFLVKAALAYE